MSLAVRQLPLDLGHRNALGRDDFLVTESNRDAVAWIDLWPEWHAPCLVLYGPVASGKTHLGAVWAEKSSAVCVKATSLKFETVREIADMAQHIIIEDADQLIGDRATETGLFHLYNIFKEEQKSFLLTMVEPPIRQDFVVKDLASRLRAAPNVSIREPNEDLLSALLVKAFNDRQITLNADVIQYLMPRMERSFKAVRDLAEIIDSEAMSQKRNITVPFIRDILKEHNFEE
ncbi:MAG: DnaA/Hda family protein [Pseudomonadota bacterium]